MKRSVIITIISKRLDVQWIEVNHSLWFTPQICESVLKRRPDVCISCSMSIDKGSVTILHLDAWFVWNILFPMKLLNNVYMEHLYLISYLAFGKQIFILPIGSVS